MLKSRSASILLFFMRSSAPWRMAHSWRNADADKEWIEDAADNDDIQNILLPCFLPNDEWELDVIELRDRRKEF